MGKVAAHQCIRNGIEHVFSYLITLETLARWRAPDSRLTLQKVEFPEATVRADLAVLAILLRTKTMSARRSEMTTAFSQPAVLAIKVALLALLLIGVAIVALAKWRMEPAHVIAEPVDQPIPFSHKHHVGDDGLDCRYCHTSVEKSGFAGMPSTNTCLTCHSQLYVDAPALKPLHESARSGRPIAWARVHDVPGFAYFEHDIHVNKGVACIECHGQVDQMPLTARVASLSMQWCLSCHRSAPQHVRPLSQVLSMAPQRPLTQDEIRQLNAYFHLRDGNALSNCSTCHR